MSSTKEPGGTKRVPRASTRLLCGAVTTLPPKPAAGQALPEEAGSAVLGDVRVQVEHRGVAAQGAGIGVGARFALTLADDLDAVVVERGARGCRLLPQFPRAGRLSHQPLHARQFVGFESGHRPETRPALRGVRMALDPVVLGDAPGAHRIRVGQHVVEDPVVPVAGGFPVGEDRQRRGSRRLWGHAADDMDVSVSDLQGFGQPSANWLLICP